MPNKLLAVFLFLSTLATSLFAGNGMRGLDFQTLDSNQVTTFQNGDSVPRIKSLINFSNDSLENDTASLAFQPFQPKPKVAGLWSAFLPGAGQVYNRQYWKPILIAAGGVTIGYYIKGFSRSKEFYRQVLVLHDVDSSAAHIESFVDDYPSLDKITNASGKHIALFSEEQIQAEYDSKRSTLQNLYIFGVVLYGLNVLDAVVSAHLKNFDVSDDLTLNVRPSIMNTSNTLNGLGAGISLKLSLR